MALHAMHAALPPRRASRLASLARFTTRYRWLVIGVWVVLTLSAAMRRKVVLAVVSEPRRSGPARL